MAIFPIRTFGDPVLRTPAAVVEEFDAALAKLADDMLETMYDAPGVGLAAPQIGISKRIVVFDAGDGPKTLVNPELVTLEEPSAVPGTDQVMDPNEVWEYDEGCLSVPGKWWPIERPAHAWARGFDVDGNPVEHAGDELLGRVLQHEIDHINGILLLDRLSKRARRQALKELRNEALGL